MNTIILPDISGKRRRVSVGGIEYLEGDGNYTHVHLSGGATMYISSTIGKMADRLPGFIRIHKQYSVNPAHVKSFSTDNTPTVGVSAGRLLPVSRRRFIELRSQLSALCKPSSATKA